MGGDPVAWQMIEQGWTVLDADGEKVGRVDRVTGDIGCDIFNGITVGDGGVVLTRARYVAAEHVTAIREGEVVIDLHAEDVAKLEPYVAPVSEPLAALLPPEEDKSHSGRGSTFGGLFRRRP